MQKQVFKTEIKKIYYTHHTRYFLAKGSAVACVSFGGEMFEVARYHPGDYFGEMAGLYRQKRMISVYALSPNTKCLCIVDAGFFINTLRENPILLPAINRKVESYRVAYGK